MKKRIRNALLTIIMVLSIATTCIITPFGIFSITSLTVNAVDNAQEDSTVDPYVDIFDFNCDKMVNMTDAVILSRILAEDVSVFDSKFEFLDPNGDGLLTATDAVLLLLYLAENSTPQVNPNTTETTTSTTETTTTETTTSTTVTTTTTTAKTTTTTTETTASVTQNKSIELLTSILDNINVTDSAIPAYNCELYEVVSQIYLFKVGNQTYAYTILINKNEGLTSGDILLAASSYIKGLHIWLYNGTTAAVSESDSLPNTNGLTFYCEDPSVPNKTVFEYSLREYSRITKSNIVSIVDLVANNRFQHASDIKSYDYNLNGTVDTEDVQIMVKYFVSNPYNFFWSLNEEAFNIYLENLPELGHTNVVLLTTQSTTPVEFAFNIPTGVIEYTDYATELPVQVLPTSYNMSGYEYEELDEEADFYAWIPQWDLWTYLSLQSGNWSFSAGYYVYCLDSNGKYVTELIK